jgi:ATP-dependent Zn protease
MMMGATPKMKATAYHEAGHAVASWRLGEKFKYVTVAPDADSIGHVRRERWPKWFHPDFDSSDRIRLRVERHIVISFAGQLVEAKFLGKHPRYGMHADNEIAVDMAFHVGGSVKTVEAFLHYCWSVSEDLVACNWRFVEVIAEALLDKETLQYVDVIEVIMPGSAALRVSLAKSGKEEGEIR